ncbi:TonB-dependent receptor [Sphingomonas sp. AR_OL41]|uniref:TonB-dependent receptor n=1 Tax=Sphingomonas sp. AR_OL41 TaxID=3042729 RepID=UPI002480B31D|nr:TonB-dependent receptor [Sphingomonas sp. AR_OL41]MDH7970909.1 TonB-dependent receptor [Sphingomonas sp. AR_OL41]
MLSSIAMLLASAAPVAAPAEPAPVADSSAAQDAQASGDIVVTAQRRQERAQDVPIALSVVSANDLSRTGAFNVNRLQQLQPSLQFYSSNPRNSSINIRGLGTPFGLTNDGIEQGVGFYLDGVYVGRVGASTFDFVDVERIEVLRGPQGTLYGKNTTAGAVNITTRAPSFSPEAQLEASAGNDDYYQVKGSVSGPLVSDTLAARLSTSFTRRGGTIYDATGGRNLHKLDNLSVRGQLLWKPRADLDFRLTGDFNAQNPLCCVQYYARVGSTQRPANRQYAALAAALGYTVPSSNPFDRVTDLDATINSRQEMGGASLVGNWDIGPATITSVSAWRYWDWKPANDRDFVGLPITTVSQNPSQQHQYSQEFRIASNGKNKLNYTFGAFFFTQKINTQGSQVQGAAASRWLLNPGNVAVGSSGCASPTADACNPLVLNGLTSTNTINFSNQSAALYGKLSWSVTDRLRISPGLRVNYDKKSGYYDSVVSIHNAQFDFLATADNVAALLAAQPTAAAKATFQNQINTLAPQHYTPAFSAWNVSGDITIAYDFTSDIHGYATYARSFKSGGINLSGLPLNSTSTAVDLTTQTVRPEKVNHFELGLKTQFLDRRLTVNVAGYWDVINDYQATVNNNAINVIRGYLANAGQVRARGVEFDSSFRPSERLSLYFNGAYTDATYTRFTNAPCPPELSGGGTGTPASPAGTAGGNSPALCDISGQVLPGVSKWALSFGGEVNKPVGAGEVYLGYDGSYRTRFSSNPSPSADTWINGYSLSNFRLGYRQGSFNIFAWMRNAFDHHYFELLSVQSGSTGLIVGQPGDPRTFGATISKKF